MKDAAVASFQLSPAQLTVTQPSGQATTDNRVGWALAALTKGGALIIPDTNVLQITVVGRQLLNDNPTSISETAVTSLPGYRTYVSPSKRRSTAPAPAAPADGTPTPPAAPTAPPTPTQTDDPVELIEAGIAAFETDVADELIRRLRAESPDFFEQAVVDVLLGMGYGGADQRVTKIGGSGDGGVDGVIDQDPLGLNRIFMQAKRYADGNIVGSPELQGFVGALADKGANQGVFVTTSTFSLAAREYVEKVSVARVILVDGMRLASLMIRYRVGVRVTKTYDVVEVDDSFFG